MNEPANGNNFTVKELLLDLTHKFDAYIERHEQMHREERSGLAGVEGRIVALEQARATELAVAKAETKTRSDRRDYGRWIIGIVSSVLTTATYIAVQVSGVLNHR